MEVIIYIAPVVMLPICVIAWKHGLTGNARTLMQGLLVVFAAMTVSGQYLSLKVNLHREPDFFEKFWLSLPLWASFVVTGRCVFGRLFQLIVTRTRQRSQKAR